MSEFRFANPEWVHGLWGVLAFVVLLFWLDLRGTGALDLLIGSALQRRLVTRPSAWRRRLRITLLGLSAACLVLALMRPQLGFRHVSATRVGAEIMVALDVSKSMLAEDVAPNRLERAKAEIIDLLAYLDGDQVGLIAFAGRATVLAPLTPDFSFLRLVLDSAGPHSVSRGGTRLEEPIRKAIQGFDSAGGASRALLLITDGEDHDSFPLDAAADAAEAGIVIIAIGFGDELGSEIYLTDPRSGARTVLRDADGRPVRSRLDGDLLRDLASATGGAYVPAGTGVLDLESIYRQHIERLVVGQLDPRGRTVRDEGYQWAVLLALVLLVSSTAISSGTRFAAAVLALLTLSASPPARAGDDAETDVAGQSVPAADDIPDESPPGLETTESAEEPETPREIYNRGVAALVAGDSDQALRWLERARREAGTDGELRFQSAYDLGLASAQRAERFEAESPQDALRALYTAADWFRDAIGQRPEDDDSRTNLDVALRRALLLADRLAQQHETGIDSALRAIADRQRGLLGELAQLTERVSDEFADQRLRREFRARATDQRTLLSDSDRLAGQIDSEREAIVAAPDAERTTEEQMRAAQLESALHYLHRARERMGQARRQLRQRQGERAFRRASAALAELKRALDQLRDPVAVLDALLREAARLASSSAALAASRRSLPGSAAVSEVPAWLNSESLADDQRALAERTDELDLRLLAGLERPQVATPEEQSFFDAVRAAEPLVASAHERFETAVGELESDEPEAALAAQAEALVALADARERFLDLRGLIEATYADERRIEGVLGAEGATAESARAEYLPGLRELQARNIVRAERLAEQIASAAREPPPPPPDGSATGPDARAIQQQRFDLAGQLLTLALARMDELQRSLGAGDRATADWSAAREAGRAALGHLEMLRRLFFSIAEQLRDAVREQVDLADVTREIAALVDPDSDVGAARLGPLRPRQQDLAERAGSIANALEEQSNESGGVLDEETAGWETSRRLRLAGEHVVLAQGEMDGAVRGLAAEPPEFEPTQASQANAVSELEEALALLVPPEQREPEGESGESGESGDSEAPEPGADDPQQSGESGADSPSVDPAQLLQAVRDRDAQRRRDRQQRSSAGYETVEKDW